MLSLAEATRHAPKAVLLSADMAPPALRKRIERAWNCETFNHYGLTESGWGGAVECAAHRGCHIRELDLLIEIVDFQGMRLPEDAWGEVVLTTLRRPSFPLIRYRTGDRGRLLSGICPCGSPLKRLEVTGRLPIEGASGTPLDLYEVENTLWSFEEIQDFSLLLEYEGSSPAALTALLGPSQERELPLERIQKALGNSPGVPLRIHLKKHPEPFLTHKHPKRNWRCYN
jgi:phenylacetate-coenzyme A ligase PaaK-like adenylate-forming protein